jgi:transposase
MFIRTRERKNGKVSISIVETQRKSGKVCQQTLRNVATVPISELDYFMKIAKHIQYEMEHAASPKLFSEETLAALVVAGRRHSLGDESPMPVDLRKLREEARIVTGIHEIYGKLYDEIGFGKVFKRCRVSGGIMKDIVMARLAKPCSKRSSVELLERDFGIPISPEKVYRMMDALTNERIKRLQDICWGHSRNLLTQEIKVMFYDCTTLYFESFTEDELRRFGYSKDNKFNQGQVLLALMVTMEGLPVGYEVFPGNMYEGDTFKYALDKIKNRYKISRAIVVADSGLLSKENIALLENEKYEYILGARLKSLSKKWQNKILDNTDYLKIKEEDNEILRISTYSYDKNRQLIVSHSSKRAEKDRCDREKAVDKLKKKLEASKNPKSLISNYGHKKFLAIAGEIQVEIDKDKLDREALWDGLHGVFANVGQDGMSAVAVLEQYHGLWQVEESFRINKHDLRMRPIFHWSPHRIHAHIAVCFVAFALIRFLEFRIKTEVGESMSAERICKELYRVQESIVKDSATNNKYVIPSNISQDALKLYEVMHVKRNAAPFRLAELG